MSGPTQLHPALKRREEEQRRLLDVARLYARRLADLLPVRWVVVAGSVARGDFHDGSDVDVLVLSDHLPHEPLRRAEVLLSVVEGGVEPRGVRLDELPRELRRRNPLVVEALTRGVVVYPEGRSLEDLRRDLRVEAPDPTGAPRRRGIGRVL